MNLYAFTTYTLSLKVHNDLNGQWPLNISVSLLCNKCNIIFSDFPALVQGSNPVYFAASKLPIDNSSMGNLRAILKYQHHDEVLQSHQSSNVGWDEVFKTCRSEECY
jgi:hypothetical protein